MRLFISAMIIMVIAVLFVPTLVSAEDLTGNEAVVMDMFESFYELEAEFRSGRWSEALKEFDEVEATYRKVIDALRGRIGSNLLQETSADLKEVRSMLKKKDAEAVEVPYMKVQDNFMNIMEQMDYPSPPVLIVISLYTDEAIEFLEKGQLNQVADEMEEIEHFRSRALDRAAAAGMDSTKLEPLFEMAEDVNKIAEKGRDKALIETKLKEMKAIMGQYVK